MYPLSHREAGHSTSAKSRKQVTSSTNAKTCPHQANCEEAANSGTSGAHYYGEFFCKAPHHGQTTASENMSGFASRALRKGWCKMIKIGWWCALLRHLSACRLYVRSCLASPDLESRVSTTQFSCRIQSKPREVARGSPHQIINNSTSKN